MTELKVWDEPKTPEIIMNELFEKYNKDSLYVLLSGGKDSVCIADYIAENYPDKFKGCVFTNVGLGAQETRKFVISYCNERGWKLFLTWPSEKERLYNIVMTHGFAGDGNHKMWMGFLKYHTWRAFILERLKLGEKACFISGVRKKESKARDKIKKYTRQPIDIDDKMVFCKPFLYKNGLQLWNYFIEHNLKKSPVYEWLNKSGECLCGAHAQEWELKLLEKFDRLAFESIKWLEQQIEKFGSKKAKKYNKWGNGPKTQDIEEQTTLENFNEDYCGESCVIE